MSLPYASQAQINEMNKRAEKMGVAEEPKTQDQVQANQSAQENIGEDEANEAGTSYDAASDDIGHQQDQALSAANDVSSGENSDKEENFKNLRERAKKAERERDELIRYVQSLQKESTNSNTSKQLEKVEDQLEEFKINPDDLAEGKHLQMLYKKIKQLESSLHTAEKENKLSAAEIKIKRDFPDFEKVASYDNLQKLRQMDSDLADAILATKDTYKQHALAYKMVKQLGIYHPDNFTKEKEIAQRNHAKPRPLTSISPQQGESPLSHANAFANGLTDELKAQLAKEMYEARKRM